jgi:YD repeat-containing protein
MKGTYKMKKLIKLFFILLIFSIFILSSVSALAATFNYDALGRLVEFTCASGRTISYEYDTNGNIVSIKVDGVNVFTVSVESENADYTIGSGDYEPGEIVNIFAGIRSRHRFSNWTALPSVSFHNPLIHYTSFIMPASDITATANWENVIVKRGDVNGDSEIDEADVALLTRFLLATDKIAFRAANPEFVYENADINGDGTVTAADLTLLRFLLYLQNDSQ